MNKSKKYFLKTSRLGFRQWCEDDLGIATGLWGDYEVTKFYLLLANLPTYLVNYGLAKQ